MATTVGVFEIHSAARGPHWIAWVSRPGSEQPHGSIVLVGETQQEAEARAARTCRATASTPASAASSAIAATAGTPAAAATIAAAGTGTGAGASTAPAAAPGAAAGGVAGSARRVRLLPHRRAGPVHAYLSDTRSLPDHAATTTVR